MTRPAHPLDPLTAAEISAARAVLVAEGKVGESTRFPLVLPEEPDRRAALAHREGHAFSRQVRVTRSTPRPVARPAGRDRARPGRPLPRVSATSDRRT